MFIVLPCYALELVSMKLPYTRAADQVGHITHRLLSSTTCLACEFSVQIETELSNSVFQSVFTLWQDIAYGELPDQHQSSSQPRVHVSTIRQKVTHHQLESYCC
jgi:hypothetical protein